MLRCAGLPVLMGLGLLAQTLPAQPQTVGNHAAQASHAQLVMIDTDIGDDIDDAFAVGLALASPELQIVGISSAWSDPALKARLLDRLLAETGRSDIPVAEGLGARLLDTHLPAQGPLSQARWAMRQPPRAHAAAVDQLLSFVAAHPGEVTLIGLGPLTNLGAAIDRDPAVFRRLKRIVIMGGSINRGYRAAGTPEHGPDAEYNIATDVAAARKVFAAGVPLYVMPLDATEIDLDEARRRLFFAQSTPLTDAIALLYDQWALEKKLTEPTLFDPVAVGYAVEPALCPVTPMRIEIDSRGMTRAVAGVPNAFVCLHSDPEAFLRFYMPRLLGQHLGEASNAANGTRP